jgi:hypothetical protein
MYNIGSSTLEDQIHLESRIKEPLLLQLTTFGYYENNIMINRPKEMTW